MKTTRKVKAKALATGTEAVYVGGSRSRMLRKGQELVIAAIGPNKDGSYRYCVRFESGRGVRRTTWLSGKFVRERSR